jgi:hypothetical protein
LRGLPSLAELAKTGRSRKLLAAGQLKLLKVETKTS